MQTQLAKCDDAVKLFADETVQYTIYLNEHSLLIYVRQATASM